MKTLAYALMLALISFSASAQRGDCEQRMKKVKAEKAAYISQRINFSEEEAQKFWPVYNEYNAEKETAQDEIRSKMQKLRNSQDLSDNDKIKLLDEVVALRDKRSDINVKYHEKFKKIMTADQLVEFYGAERHFKKHLLYGINKGQQGPGANKPCCPKASQN